MVLKYLKITTNKCRINPKVHEIVQNESKRHRSWQVALKISQRERENKLK